jgi:hypothetical protein
MPVRTPISTSRYYADAHTDDVVIDAVQSGSHPDMGEHVRENYTRTAAAEPILKSAPEARLGVAPTTSNHPIRQRQARKSGAATLQSVMPRDNCACASTGCALCI